MKMSSESDCPAEIFRGTKHDQDKPLVGLMVSDFATALQAVAEVTTHGANKYAPSNWRRVPDPINRYTNALYRHLLAHASEEGLSKDEESGLPHLAHAAWNILALLEFHL